jgi:hypothetical protein
MAARDGEAIRRTALPWFGEAVVGAYQKSRSTLYGEDFLELIFEGYQTYVGGSIRASIIVTGEALLRILYARIAEALKEGPLTVRHGTRVITVSPASVYDLPDELTFIQAERVLSSYINPGVCEQVDAVRFLRNRAAHSDLPLLDEWDPDDLRSAKDFYNLLSGQISIAEGYRFFKKDEWVTLAIRDHPCNTLDELSMSERLAVVQQLFVVSVIKGLFPSEGLGNTR